MSEKTLEFNVATNIHCPDCVKKICKVREYKGVPLIELRHKGIFVLTSEAIINCLDCKKTYGIEAATKTVKEVEL